MKDRRPLFHALNVFVLFFFGTLNASYASSFAVCGPLKGHTFVFNKGSLTEESKWVADGASETTVAFDGKTFDILWKGADGGFVSAKNSGLEVKQLYRDRESLILYVSSAKTTTGKSYDLYTFVREKDGALRYSIAQTKTSGLFTHTSAMSGTCSHMALE